MSELTFSDWLQSRKFKIEIYNVMFGDVMVLWHESLEQSSNPEVRKILEMVKGDEIDITYLVKAKSQVKTSPISTDSTTLDQNKIHIIDLSDDTVNEIVTVNT